MKQGKNKKGKQESPDENINLNFMEAHSYESIYLQIVPYKVKVTDGENFVTFALLDSRSQSTLNLNWMERKCESHEVL